MSDLNGTALAQDLGVCPFCRRALAVDHTNSGILHALPMCPAFAGMDALSFVIAARKELERQLAERVS